MAYPFPIQNALDRGSLSSGILLSAKERKAVQTIYLKCRPPPQGWRKLNSDGAVKEQHGMFAGGGIVRCTSLQAEAFATLDDLKLCVANQLGFIQIEADSLILIKALQGTQHSPWLIDSTIQQIQGIVQNLNVIFMHVFREGNDLADSLANIGAQCLSVPSYVG
ncbi:hypothetical protein ACH5RR_037216 [Cinchona calisaya]|uniref:RNase H type-1 domain-containing protein n=1 Tax=Cinchona calisaya TaxID=153742 RepID=A0ABD2Y5G4_9GENT